MRSAPSERELLPKHVEPVKIGDDHADDDAQDEKHEVTKANPASWPPGQMDSRRGAIVATLLKPFPVLKTHGLNLLR